MSLHRERQLADKRIRQPCSFPRRKKRKGHECHLADLGADPEHELVDLANL